jgi:glycosyltransferase involved in cell wall biosynthesis
LGGHDKKIEGDPATLETHIPNLSVVVPVYRQWDVLPDLLESLARQSLSAEAFEVIVVANEDMPPDVDPASWPRRVRLEVCLEPGAYAARNVGAQCAKGEYLVFTDADCIPASDWLYEIQQDILKLPVHILAGRISMVATARPTLWSTYDEVRGIPQEHYVARGYGACANLCIPRAPFQAVGGFSAGTLSGGDAGLCRKLGEMGFEIAFVDRAIVFHPARSTWSLVSIKARRIRGGQLQNGPLKRRVLWLGVGMFPPVKETVRFLKSDLIFRKRIAAIGVLYLLWVVSAVETCRLLFGGAAERQ